MYFSVVFGDSNPEQETKTTCELTTRKKRHHSSANLDHIHLKTVKRFLPPLPSKGGKNKQPCATNGVPKKKRNPTVRNFPVIAAASKEQRRALQMLELIEEDEEMEESEPPEAPAAAEPEATEAAPEHGVLSWGENS